MAQSGDEPQEVDLGREKVACVFTLDGGELHRPHPNFPDEWDGPGGVRHWYTGVPSYTEGLNGAGRIRCRTCNSYGDEVDCPACDGSGQVEVEVRTAILNCIDGWPTPPRGWEQVASFSSSGEATCSWCASGVAPEGGVCKLCEGEGYIYIGDGWYEIVYRRMIQTDTTLSR